MRKIALFLTVIMVLSAFTACSPAKTSAGSTPVLQTLPNDEPKTLSIFLRDMLDYKSILWKKIEQKYTGTELASEFINFNAPDYSIAILPMYDTLSLTGSGANRREGKLMLSGIPAFEELQGSILAFGFTYIYEEDTAYYKKGTVEIAKGELDFDKKTLFYEDIIKTNGETAARTVIEIVRLSDKSYAYQYIYGNEKAKKATAVFCILSQDAYTAICADKQQGSDFSYHSIRYGRTGLEDMANGFKLRLAATAGKDGAEIVKK